MDSARALVVFLGGFGASPAERLVDRARRCASLDSIDAWQKVTGATAIIATEDPGLLEDSLPPDGVILDIDPGPFHFGRRLAQIIHDRGFESVVCLGGGALPLFAAPEFANVARRLDGGGAVTNNKFSADLTAFPVTPAIMSILETVTRDNAFARVLEERAGIAVEPMPRNLATQFDLDTPTDLAALALGMEAGVARPGPRLSEYLRHAGLDLDRYRAALSLLTDRTRQLVVAGRVGTHSWSYLETETACRVRVYAEERGMEADGRSERGEVRSLLAYHLQSVGIDRFFEMLVELGDAAVIDTRVLLAHRGLDPSREDRFLSDLGRPADIVDPFLRDFTAAALAAPIPVLLGGHSLMSGDLMLLNETAWALAERGG